MFKKIIFKSYVLLLMAFTVWYGYFIYPLIFGFEGKQGAEISLKEMGHAGTAEERLFLKLLAEQKTSTKTDLGYRVVEQPYIEGRFHHIGFSIQGDKGSICINCHGNIPHDKSKQLRSFLNMHTFYLACETCHAIPETGKAAWDFSWYDKETGKITGNPLALLEMSDPTKSKEEIAKFTSFGNYGAKIAPGVDQKLLHGEEEISFVKRYLSEQDSLQHEQKSQMKRIIHRKVSNKPVACKQCHEEVPGYIPLEYLGYSPSRIGELTSVDVISIIDKIKKFYKPSQIKPGGVDK